MRELARVRAQSAKLRNERGADDESVLLLEDALQLLDRLRIECGQLQQRCSELERSAAAADEATRKLLDAMPQSIVTTDGAGIILDANRAACALLSRSRAKLINDLLLHFAEDRLAFSNAVRELPRANGPMSLRVRVRPADHAPFDAEITVHRDPRADTPRFLWLVARQSGAARPDVDRQSQLGA